LWLNSGSATVKLGSADVGLNSFTNGSPCVNNGATISPNANTITVDNCPTVSCFTDPFGPLGTVPSSSGLPLTVKCGGTSKGCPADDYNDFSWIDTTMGTGCLALYKGKYGLPNSPSGQSIYEFPRSASAVYNGVVTGNSSDKNYYFMPYCTTGVSAPGMYYFGSGLSLSGQTALNTRDSTLIFAPGVNFSNTGKTTWNLDGPDSGLFYDKPFKEGIVLYQPTNSACPADTFSFNGSVTISENGIVDLPCALVNISGDSVTGFGDMTVWELEVSGNGSLNLAPPSKDDQEWLARGALLVQ
jgi:hypothetical protein